MSFSVIFLECPAFLQPLMPGNAKTDASTQTRRMYIPGAGFSGFFYTLGRLHSLHSKSTTQHDEYFCFSAGCLALVATLMEVPLQSAVEMANGSRRKWMNGEIGRYEVVKYFVDELLYEGEGRMLDLVDAAHLQLANSSNGMLRNTYGHISSSELVKELPYDSLFNETKYRAFNMKQSHKIQHHLSKINIITSTWSNNISIITQSVRSPSTILELKQMLLQTTWIPFITGPTLGKLDASGEYHNDGAFAALLYGCKSLFRKDAVHSAQYALKLPWDVDLLCNGLNIILDYDKAILFWNKGLLRE